MNPRLRELAERQGVLKARIAQQRRLLAFHAQPLADAFGVADRAVKGVQWLKKNPLALGLGVLALFALRPGLFLRWGKRGLFFWQAWLKVKKFLPVP